jgi:two-component system nitrate/nitrite response regulator NarL
MPRDVLRILVAADDPLARAGLATLLAGQPGWSVVGRIAMDADLPVSLEAYSPDVGVWDLGWNPAPAIERLALARGILPSVALLPNDSHVVEAWAAGAQGLLLRDADAERLAAAVTAVAHGLTAFDPALVAALAPVREQAPVPPLEALTPRELEVLRLLAEGLSNKAIARRLEISEHTVKFHTNAILGKLGAQSRTEAVVRATRQGLILL